MFFPLCRRSFGSICACVRLVRQSGTNFNMDQTWSRKDLGQGREGRGGCGDTRRSRNTHATYFGCSKTRAAIAEFARTSALALSSESFRIFSCVYSSSRQSFCGCCAVLKHLNRLLCAFLSLCYCCFSQFSNNKLTGEVKLFCGDSIVRATAPYVGGAR